MQPNSPSNSLHMHGAQRTLLYGRTPNVTPKRINSRDADTQYVYTNVVEDSDCG